MTTLVFFHAHPDDEAIYCGGTVRKAAEEGHRAVVVFATRGELGEKPEGLLREGESLAERRVNETKRAADLLRAARIEFLGYSDSGMMGMPDNDAPSSFWKADVEEAARKLAAILEEEQADALSIYDEKGDYGHPDHIQVHNVGVRAAELAGTPKVYENVYGREMTLRLWSRLGELGITPPVEEPPENMGVPEETITTSIDVREYLHVKRDAMAAHASQIPDTSFFLMLPPSAFEEAFGTEHYRLRGAPPGFRETTLFDAGS